MSSTTDYLPAGLYDYVLNYGVREPRVAAELRRATAELPEAVMQISPEQGQFFRLLLPLMGARRTLEVGVFTGYSTLCAALALPEDGQVVACDVSEEWTAMGRQFWKLAGVDGRIDLRIAPAQQTLEGLLAEGQAGQFDFAFIDADKVSYFSYYQLCLELLRPGGLIAIDNVLWSGKVADDSVTDPDTVALRELNAWLKTDTQVQISMLPLGDGLTLARKC